MKRSAALIRILLFLGAAARTATPVVAEPSGDIIARAREYLGGDARLSAIQSLHFIGVLETQKSTPSGLVPQKATIEIFFQKPFQQRIVVTGAETVETTGLDGYAAWQREESLTDPQRWNMSVLGPDTIKWLRATAWQNLNFYKGIEEQGGTVKVLGAATIDGHAAIKVAIAHDAKIVFFYYFDAATGKLLLTETSDRTTSEEGEILVDGLRFPKKETQTVKGRDASGRPIERKLVMTFEKITLNEVFPASYFEVPLLRSPRPAPVVNSSGPRTSAAPADTTPTIRLPDTKPTGEPAATPTVVK